MVLSLEREVKALIVAEADARNRVKSLSAERARVAVAMKDADKHHEVEQRKRRERMGKLLNQVVVAERDQREATTSLADRREQLHALRREQLEAELAQ